VIALCGPGGDFALDDDWAYAWSARHLAATGELRILDWAAPSLATHVAWGAALVRLVGPSHVVLRAGTLGWALGGLLVLYAIGRRSAFSTGQSLALALSVGLSPWYVNLSFTYMTEVPWLVLMLGAAAVALGPDGTRARSGLLAGVLLALAALSRQFAVVALPPFALLAALDARAAGGPGWRRRALGRAALLVGPTLVFGSAFALWYARVHGPTLAFRSMPRGFAGGELSVGNALAIGHYLGFFALPWVLALVAARRPGAGAGRAALATAALALGAFAVVAWQRTHAEGAGLSDWLCPTFPYLTNVVWLLGAGPPTLYETYVGRSPLPHHPAYLGFALSALTTVAGAHAVVWLGRALARIAGSLGAAASPGPRDRARLLLVGTAALYLVVQAATSRFLFDRYVFVAMPAAVWLALDALPAPLGTARVALAAIALVALFSVGATREYLAWNGARDRAVRDLEARGVPASDIDGGFEVNGARLFAAWFRRTGTLNGEGRNVWWAGDARHRLAFRADAIPGCREESAWPYWSWPGAGPRAIHVLDCGSMAGAIAPHEQ
jgi:hypothetical protein